jgi:hypothetical protein
MLAFVHFVELIFVFLQEVFIVHLLADCTLDDVPSAVPEMRCRFLGWNRLFAILADLALFHLNKIVAIRRQILPSQTQSLA